jgi:hypothetical protein
LDTDQSKQIDHVHQFTTTRKMGANIKQNILLKIFDQETSQNKMLSDVDYGKGILNRVVMEPKEKNNLQIYLLILM